METNAKRHDSVTSLNRVQITIGLDFGTSFTKVIVGDSLVRYVVPFDRYCRNSDRYLLPSAVNVRGEGERCNLGGSVTGSDTVYDDLKVPLIERDFSDDVQVRITAYLALVLRHTRDWFTTEYDDIYGDRTIEWFINVGLPTEKVEDDELNRVYKAIVQAAWHLSVLNDEITLPYRLRYSNHAGVWIWSTTKNTV